MMTNKNELPKRIWLDDAAGCYTDDPAIRSDMTEYIRADLVPKNAWMPLPITPNPPKE